MGKQEYLDALKKAMTGLPPELVAKTLAYYEQRFIDGLTVGRSEEEIYKELDEPRKIAMTLRANAHLSAFEQKKTPATAARMIVSLAGLAVFNLFMVIPAIVFSALLIAVYTSSFVFYMSGIAMTASGMAGANEMVFNGPLRHLTVYDEDGEAHYERLPTKVSIGADGIQVFQDPSPELSAELDDETSRSGKLLDRAEAMADSGVRISIDPDNESRTTQTLIGGGLILGGITLFLLSLVVTRYTMSGIKRYVQMNKTLLRGR